MNRLNRLIQTLRLTELGDRVAALAGTGSRLPAPVAISALVVAAAALLLAGSQFLDYRTVEVATDDYVGVEAVAPPPRLEAETETAGAAHAYLMIPLAIAALALLAGALRDRWRLSRLIAPLGLIAIAITLLVDLPAAKDLDEAQAAFEGVEYVLLSGFWAQLAAAGVLVVGSIVLAANLQATTPGAIARRSRRAGGRRAAGAQEAGT